MIVAVVNLKGGVGKTTSSIALACAAVAAGDKARVVDADSQGSATAWGYAADDAGAPLPFAVEEKNQSSIARLKSGKKWTFIDCPPTGNVTDAAVDVADFVIVPMTPSELDMRQTWATIDSLESRNKHYSVLVTRADKRTIMYKGVIEALKEADISYFETAIPQREDVKNSFRCSFDDELYGYDKVLEEIKGAV